MAMMVCQSLYHHPDEPEQTLVPVQDRRHSPHAQPLRWIMHQYHPEYLHHHHSRNREPFDRPEVEDHRTPDPLPENP